MRAKRYSNRVGADGPIFLAAIMEYLCAEVLDTAAEVCLEFGKKRITPRHIELAVRGDDELSRVFQN